MTTSTFEHILRAFPKTSVFYQEEGYPSILLSPGVKYASDTLNLHWLIDLIETDIKVFIQDNTLVLDSFAIYMEMVPNFSSKEKYVNIFIQHPKGKTLYEQQIIIEESLVWNVESLCFLLSIIEVSTDSGTRHCLLAYLQGEL